MMSGESFGDGGDSTVASTAASSAPTIPDGKAEEDQQQNPVSGEGGGEDGDDGDDTFDQESPSKVRGGAGGGSPSPDLEEVDVELDHKLSQLPNPDTLPRDPIHQEKLRVRKKKACLGAVGLMLVCALVVVTVSYFGPADAGKNIPGLTTSSETETSETEAGTPAPGFYDDDEDGKGDDEEEGEDGDVEEHESDAARLADARSFLSQYGTSDLEALDALGSPQRLALEWICTSDPLRIPVPHYHLGPTDTWGVVDRVAEMKFVQRYTMAVIYYALKGGKWKSNLTFLTGRVECDWNDPYETKSGGRVDLGAVCGDPSAADETGWNRITRIWIPWDHGLEGTLPPEIRHLTRLTSISMAYGRIGGEVPKAVCSLAQLEELSLSNNLVTGALPSCMKQMSALRILALDDNLLTGDLSVLNDIKPLQYVYLEDNGFEDTIDDNFLNDHDRLIHLDLSDNKLAGGVPSHFFKHPALRVLDLHDNELTGPLPSVIEEQTTLEFLALHKNKLNGEIPASLGNLKELVYLDLAHNEFTGDLTGTAGQALGTLPLKYLFLGGNKYDTQPFPSFLVGMTKLLELSLKDSNISAPIPNWIGALNRLYLLDLDGNALYDSIPPELGDLTRLNYLLLNRNQLTGEVPSSMANLTDLNLLLLDDNSLSGSLDDTVCPVLSNDTQVAADCAPRTADESGVGAPEIRCSSACCEICCEDNGEPCNDEGWIANNDPIWEHRYGRYRFKFEDEIN